MVSLMGLLDSSHESSFWKFSAAISLSTDASVSLPTLHGSEGLSSLVQTDRISLQKAFFTSWLLLEPRHPLKFQSLGTSFHTSWWMCVHVLASTSCLLDKQCLRDLCSPARLFPHIHLILSIHKSCDCVFINMFFSLLLLTKEK